LDRSNGLLSHYRVFANGRRFGGGAWDWPSTAARLADGRVEVRWAAAPDRPLAMRALYALPQPDRVTVETIVEPQAELRGFEVFLASYFEAGFTNAAVAVKSGGADVFLPATPDRGDWQMYVRDAAAKALALDGRWTLEPNPVAWTFPAELSGPQVRARRWAAGWGIQAGFSAAAADCFAVAMPQQTEGHYSLYYSLFGRTLAAGQPVQATVTLEVAASR
jgi:hypothetical protein